LIKCFEGYVPPKWEHYYALIKIRIILLNYLRPIRLKPTNPIKSFSFHHSYPLRALIFSALPVVLSGCLQHNTSPSATLPPGSSATTPGINGSSNTRPSPAAKKIIPTWQIHLEELALPLEITGRIEPDFNKEVDITSHVSGRVQKVSVQLGDAVSKGRLLCIIESKDVSDLEAELVEAQSKLSIAEAREKRESIVFDEQVQRPKALIQAQTEFKEASTKLELAESEFKRLDSLHKEKIASGKDFLVAKSSLANAQALYEQAVSDLQREKDLYKNQALMSNDLHVAKAETQREQQHLNTLKQRLEIMGMTKEGINHTLKTGKLSGELSIEAPTSGIITHQDLSAGELVHPNKPMFTITDLSTVVLSADLPETHLDRVKLGMAVGIRILSHAGSPRSGRVSFIGEHVSPETNTVAIKVRLDNSDHRLKKDMSAKIDLEPQTARVLMCPQAAILERRGQTSVFVRNIQGEFEQRAVSVGASRGDQSEIFSGLKDGDVVAVGNLQVLHQDALPVRN